MRNRVLLSSLLLISSLAAQRGSQIVVANRGSGDISVFDAHTTKLLRTVALPMVGNVKGEPMYVVQSGREVMVGDRAHDRIVCFDSRNYSVKGVIPVGDGVFHMWGDGRQLWVNNDVDKTASVIDQSTNKVIRTVPMPAALVANGYKNHDVFVGRGFAWISMLKSGSNGVVLQYSTRSFRLLRRAEVGKDPHLWLDRWTGLLAVVAQNSNRVDFLSGASLRRLHSLDLPGAHGVFSPRWSRAMYVTNLPGLGKQDLYNVRLPLHRRAKPRLVSTTDTGASVAHNTAATPFGLRVWVTHSGATSSTVTVFAPRGRPWAPRGLRKIATVKAGINPFGLGFVRPR